MVTTDKKKNNKVTPLDDCPDWTFELLEKYQTEIARVAKSYRLDTYVNQIEVITAEQMMDAYAGVGMPIGYNHWTFGKKFQDLPAYPFGGITGSLLKTLNPSISSFNLSRTIVFGARSKKFCESFEPSLNSLWK